MSDQDIVMLELTDEQKAEFSKVIHTGGCPEERTLEFEVEFRDDPA